MAGGPRIRCSHFVRPPDGLGPWNSMRGSKRRPCRPTRSLTGYCSRSNVERTNPEQPMISESTVYVVSWNGDPSESIAVLRTMYPGHEIVAIDKRTLTDNHLAGRIRVLRQLRGKALVFFSR